MKEVAYLEIAKKHPIGHGLDIIRRNLRSACESSNPLLPASSLCELDVDVLQGFAMGLTADLERLHVLHLLPSVSGRKSLREDIVRLNSAVVDENVGFDYEKLIPLFIAILDGESDEIIWQKVYGAVTEITPTPRVVINDDVKETPIRRNTSSFANSSEQRKYVDAILKEELGSVFIGIPGFFEAFFKDVEKLDDAANAVYQRCTEGEEPLFDGKRGWKDWPKPAAQDGVIEWLNNQVGLFVSLAKDEGFSTVSYRRLWALPDKPIRGSTAERKLDIAFINREDEGNIECHWSEILVPGELKSNPDADDRYTTWLDLARYVREVFAAQDSRRFVLGFTLCGSIMRLWAFDRIGATASPPFDINQDGQQFVSAILGFLLMGDFELGFDPTIKLENGKRFIEVDRDGKTERLIIEGLMTRAPCIAGRATTCWKASREGDTSNAPLVIKDSWQYPERQEEGVLLQAATRAGVVNVARYYHHETVRVDGIDDDVRYNIRKNLDMSQATNLDPYGTDDEAITSQTTLEDGTGNGSAGRKRSRSQTGDEESPRKRSRTKIDRSRIEHDRVHRRVIVQDYGKPIYRASSRVALLRALQSCIEGYESLYSKTKMLQGDISTGNLMMNEQPDNPSWPGFLIDLDLAIKTDRTTSSGAWGKTGTRAFMAIGLLLGEKHTFMHDLESFFWVLFWICIHYDGPNKKGRVVPKFDEWNYADTEILGDLKKGIVTDERDFLKTVDKYFTPYYKPLRSSVNNLREVMFPKGQRRVKQDVRVFSRMKTILQSAQLDPAVIGSEST